MIFTKKQEELRQSARDFAQNEVKPRIGEFITSKDFMPRDLYKRMGDLGFIGVLLPEEAGGMGGGLTELTIITEEISRVSPVLGLSLNCICPNIALYYNVPILREKYFDGLLSGDLVYSISITPPEGFTNGTEWRPIAKLDGDEWVINGTKLFSTAMLYTDVNQVVGADENGCPHAFILPGDTPGFGHDVPENKFGMKGSGGGTVTYKDVRVPVEFSIDTSGDDGSGNYLFWQQAAVTGLGAAEGALEQTIEYTKTHYRNGKLLAADPAITNKLAELQVLVYAAQALAYDAAADWDSSDNHVQGMFKAESTKVFLPELAHKVTKECLFIQGAEGYATIGAHHFFADNVCSMICDGPTEFHLDVLASSLGFYA